MDSGPLCLPISIYALQGFHRVVQGSGLFDPYTIGGQMCFRRIWNLAKHTPLTQPRFKSSGSAAGF